jgi:hypothetical protein
MSLCTEDEPRTKLCPFSFSSSGATQCVASECRADIPRTGLSISLSEIKFGKITLTPAKFLDTFALVRPSPPQSRENTSRDRKRKEADDTMLENRT